MIYIKRFIWVFGWCLVFILGAILFWVGLFLFPFISLFYYIKDGDTKAISDKCLPSYWPTQLENVYRKLEPKPRKED